MGYMHIDNLYKNQDVLMFREAYALEKIHGTSAHVAYGPGGLTFFSGGATHEHFVTIFDRDSLAARMAEVGKPVKVYGEAYGGKMQRMGDTYGKTLRFVAFDVEIDGGFLDVPRAEKFVLSLGLEFVHYRKVSTDLASLDAERDADSVQAIRNGCGAGKLREGVVLRPLVEVRKNNGARIIAKHKREVFRETKGPRPVDAAQLAVLSDAQAIAEEWATEERLTHVLDAFPGAGMEHTKDIIAAMIEDVEREGEGEIVTGKEARRAIGCATVALFKGRLERAMREGR